MSKAAEQEVNGEVVKGGRNFKTSQEVEAFYRFVHENGLRREAKMIVEAIHTKMKEIAKKTRKRGRKKLQ